MVATMLPSGSTILRHALPEIAQSMVTRSHPKKPGDPAPRVTEATLKTATKEAIAGPVQQPGLHIEPKERTISPPQWPRVGNVDLVIATPASREAATTPSAFVELKWGLKDSLWYCVWDIAKSAVVNRVGLCEEALLLVGHSDKYEWAHAKYGKLLKSKPWTAHEFQTTFADEWKYWARPAKPGEDHPTGPYMLPARFDVELLHRHAFQFRDAAWSLGLLRVEAPGDEWTHLDDWARPVALGADLAERARST